MVVHHHRRSVKPLSGAKRAARSAVKIADWNATGRLLARLDRLVQVGEAIDAGDGTEHLLPRDPDVCRRLDQHGWRDCRLGQARAASRDRRARRLRLLDPGHHPVGFLRQDQRPDLRLRQQRIADLERLHGIGEAGEKAVLDRVWTKMRCTDTQTCPAW